MSTGRLSTTRRRHVKGQLAKRDGARCFFCTVPFGEGLAGATIDHLIPFRRFPRNVQENLVLACESCNVTKDDQAPEEFLRVSLEELAAYCGRPVPVVAQVLRSPATVRDKTRRRVLTALRAMATQPHTLTAATATAA